MENLMNENLENAVSTVEDVNYGGNFGGYAVAFELGVVATIACAFVNKKLNERKAAKAENAADNASNNQEAEAEDAE